MILIKSKSTRQLNSGTCLSNRAKQINFERVSFSSLLKENVHQSETRFLQKCKNISKQKLNFPKKMLFSQVDDSQRGFAINIRSPNSLIHKQKSDYFCSKQKNQNKLFTNLLKSRRKSELSQNNYSSNLCTFSRDTADSEYWSNSGLQPETETCRTRNRFKYFQKNEPLIKQKNRKSDIKKQVFKEYYMINDNIKERAIQNLAQMSFGDSNFVNTSKQSIQFDMSPYLEK